MGYFLIYSSGGLSVDKGEPICPICPKIQNSPLQDTTPLLDFHSTFSGNPEALHSSVAVSPVNPTTSFSPLCSNHGAT